MLVEINPSLTILHRACACKILLLQRMFRSGIIIILIFISSRIQAQSSFDERTTDASNVRLNISNVGTFGNAFRGYRDGSGNPSCEYPAGSGIEHMFEGGIWVGGLIDGNVVAVSTSAYDAPQGYATGRAGFEFTAEPGSRIFLRSSLQDQPVYSPEAVSHQDFISIFSDKNLLVPGTSIPIQSHDRPMNIEVRQEVYNWNYSFSDFFVILNYTVINKGSSIIDSVHFGLWANSVVRNINVTAAGSGGSAFYNKGGNGYLDSLYMAYCYDAAGDLGFTESYIGQKFLGAEDKDGFHHPEIDPLFKVHYNAWEFNNTSNPVFFLPASEQARYIKLTQGFNYDKCWEKSSTEDPDCGPRSIKEQLNTAGNRSDLLSVGPFRNFEPGDQITLSYAIVLARKNEDGLPNGVNNYFQQANLRSNALWAQTAYNGEDKNFNGNLDFEEDSDGNGKITRFILPAPPNIPQTKVVPSENKIDIYWTGNSEESIDPITRKKDFEGYRIYMSKLGFDVSGVQDLSRDLIKIADFDLSGNGLFNETGFERILLKEPVQFEGDDKTYVYKFSIDNILNGWQYALAVTAFDRGNEESNLESLESSRLGNLYRAFPGKPANGSIKSKEPFVYPNPYYAAASWEGLSNFQEQSRKLWFANLPEKCIVRIYSASGDYIDEFEHDASSYRGQDIRWNATFTDPAGENNVFSGGEHGWDLLSAYTQIIARGLYLFNVENLENGETYTGKFAIIK